MLVLKDILGGSLKITPENSDNLARQKIASKILWVLFAENTVFMRNSSRKCCFRVSFFTVSSKPCLQALPHSVLQTPLTGCCLGPLLLLSEGLKEEFRAFRVPHYNQGSYQNLTV